MANGQEPQYKVVNGQLVSVSPPVRAESDYAIIDGKLVKTGPVEQAASHATGVRGSWRAQVPAALAAEPKIAYALGRMPPTPTRAQVEATAPAAAGLAAGLATQGMSVPLQVAIPAAAAGITRLGVSGPQAWPSALGEAAFQAAGPGVAAGVRSVLPGFANWLTRTGWKPLKSVVGKSAEARRLGISETEKRFAERALATGGFTPAAQVRGRTEAAQAARQAFDQTIKGVTAPVSPVAAHAAMQQEVKQYARAGLMPEARAAGSATREFAKAPRVTDVTVGPTGQPVRTLKTAMSAEELNQQRRMVDRILSKQGAYGKYAPGRSEALKAQTGAIRKELARASPEAAEINRRWSEALLDQEIMAAALPRIAHQNPISIYEAGAALIKPTRMPWMLLNRPALSLPIAQAARKAGEVDWPNLVRAMYLAGLATGQPPEESAR